jgi:two-component system chemotaxis response regulator CheB
MTTPAKPIRTVIVEPDSSRRTDLVQALQRDADIAVVGLANDSSEAAAVVARARPDVVVLDLYLPADGSNCTIEQLMAQTPIPILILSASVDNGRSVPTVQALRAGALDALPRPHNWTPELAAQLRRTVRQLSKVHVIRHPRGNRTQLPHPHREPDSAKRPVVAIAASTGGPSALATILAGLHGLAAPVLVVQHLHPDFTSGLLEWMRRVSGLPVETATAGDIARPGRVYLAPGGLHLRLRADYRLELTEAPVTIHRPSADQLFESVAQHGPAATGVLLTGMGEDGARGLLAIRRSGGQTLAQDEATCAVFGMPRAAQRLGAVVDLLALDRMARAIHQAVSGISR